MHSLFIFLFLTGALAAVPALSTTVTFYTDIRANK